MMSIKRRLKIAVRSRRKKVGKKSNIVQVVAEEHNLTYDQAYSKMEEAKEKYDISFLQFAKGNFINADSAELEKFAERRRKRDARRILKISEITGRSIEEVQAEANRVRKKYSVTLKKYYLDRLYLLSDEELEKELFNKEQEKEALIAAVIAESQWDRKQVLHHMKKCDILYGIDSLHYKLFRCWEMSDEKIETYVTINTSTLLASKYNSKGKKYFTNKDLFDEKFKDFIGRKFWINRDTTFQQFEQFLGKNTEIFCKPLNSSYGRGAEKLRVHADHKALFNELMNREAVIVEECVKQHEDMDRLYPDCVNTIRVITILKDNVCHTVFTLVKIGNGGIVDNLVGGGIAAVIDVNDGKIITDGVDIQGNIIENHPATGTKIKGFQIPNWDMLLETVDKAIRVVPGVNYVGWDIAIGQNKIILIEGNSRPDLGLCQIPMAHKKEGIKKLFDEFLK